MEMGMRLKSFRRGPLAAEGSGSGRSASALPEALDARCEMSWRHTPGPRATDRRQARGWKEEKDQGLSKGLPVHDDAWAVKGRAWLAGPFAAALPSLLKDPLTRRSVFREPCSDCAVEC